MPLIIPSILEDDLEGFEKKRDAILKIPDVSRIQVDFSDGKFTDRKTMDVSDIDLLNPAYQWEAHLMVENPEHYFLDTKIAGFQNAIIHYEAIRDADRLRALAETLRGYKIAPGLAVNPETEVEDILPLLDAFAQILVMSVHPGHQGSELLPQTYDRLKKLKIRAQNVKIEVDGAVKTTNIRELTAAGADYLVVGSALFDPELTPTQNFQRLQQELSATA